MEIIIDAMGGDNAPQEIIKGAMLAMPETSADFIFVGKTEAIEAELAKYKYDASRVSIEDAREVIDNNESPVFALRKKKDSSIVKSLNMLKDHKDRVLITGGSTGAALAGGLLLVGRIEGVDRPAIAAMLPGINGGTLLIDTGANVDVKVENLLEFAILGSAYMEAVVGVKNPRIGLINNGAEEKKGNELTKKAYQALKEHKGIHFVGNVEPRDVLNSLADVLVCDGFVGNAVLKTAEGVGKMFTTVLKQEVKKSVSAIIGAAFMKKSLRNLKKHFSYEEYGGAPFLGVKGNLIKIHGSSTHVNVLHAIHQAEKMVNNRVIDSIMERLAQNAQTALEAEAKKENENDQR